MNVLLLTLVLSAAPVSYVPVKDYTVGDGDTVTGTLVLTEDIRLVNQSMRAASYDAWENKRNRRSEPFASFSDFQWRAEMLKGEKARSDLEKLLMQGEVYAVLRGREVYGRLLVDWYVYVRESDELVDVSDWMRDRGHVRK